MRIKTLKYIIICFIILQCASCVVKGPIGPYYHRHSPRHFFQFKYWESPFGYPYTRARHTPRLYKAHKIGRHRDRHKRWPRNYVPHPSYHKTGYGD